MRTKNYERYEGGVLVESIEVPYCIDDYINAIQAIEAEITPRRHREAILTDEGRAWMLSKELELDALRSEKNTCVVPSPVFNPPPPKEVVQEIQIIEEVVQDNTLPEEIMPMAQLE